MQYYLWLSWCAPPPAAHGISVTILPLHVPLFNCLFAVNCWIYCRTITTRNWSGGETGPVASVVHYYYFPFFAQIGWLLHAARSITMIRAIDKRHRSNDSCFFDIVLRAPAHICFVFISPPARSHLSLSLSNVLRLLLVVCVCRLWLVRYDLF